MPPKPESIKTKEQLRDRIQNIHFDGYRLCGQSFNTYFSNAGNIGVFSGDDEEYTQLVEIQKGLVEHSHEPTRKYFKLLEPITIPAHDDIPEAMYTHLYIRKPDPTPYGQHSGDIDFYVGNDEYAKLVDKVKSGTVQGAELYEQPGIGTLIELSEYDVDAIACISTERMTEQIRFRQ